MNDISGFATSQPLPSNFIEPAQNSSNLSHLFSENRVQTSTSLPASLKGRVSLNRKNPIRLKQWVYQLRGMSKEEYRDLQAIKKEISLIKRQMRQVAKEMIKEERLLAKLTKKRPGQLLDRKGPRAKLQGKLKQLNESIKQAQAFLQEKEGVTKQLASVHPHLCKGLEKEISTALQAGASYDLFTQLHANCLKIEEATINYAKNPGLTNQQQVSQTYEESLRSMATLLAKLVNDKLQKNDKKMMDFLQKKGIKVDENDEQKIDAKNLNATSCYHLLKAFAPRLSPYFLHLSGQMTSLQLQKTKEAQAQLEKVKEKLEQIATYNQDAKKRFKPPEQKEPGITNKLFYQEELREQAPLLQAYQEAQKLSLPLITKDWTVTSFTSKEGEVDENALNNFMAELSAYPTILSNLKQEALVYFRLHKIREAKMALEKSHAAGSYGYSAAKKQKIEKWIAFRQKEILHAAEGKTNGVERSSLPDDPSLKEKKKLIDKLLSDAFHLLHANFVDLATDQNYEELFEELKSLRQGAISIEEISESLPSLEL